jgi:hypothetical protein
VERKVEETHWVSLIEEIRDMSVAERQSSLNLKTVKTSAIEQKLQDLIKMPTVKELLRIGFYRLCFS